MKGKVLVLLLLINFTSFLSINAQWAKTYGGSENDAASSILQTSDGGYLILGTTESFGFGDGYSDIWAVKIDSDGAVEWQKTYGNDFTNNAFSIQQTSDGGYIVGGSIHVSSYGHQSWIIKLSPDGAVEWQNNYGDESINYAYSIQQTSDGGYVVGGSRGLRDAAGFDFVILKLTSEGTFKWSKTYGGSYDDCPSSILQTFDGGYIVAGYTTSFGAGNSDIWILKLNSDGFVEWQKSYGGIDGENASSILLTSDGGYIVAGNILSYGAGQSDVWVLKLSSEGDIEWNKAYGGSDVETAYSIHQTLDGGYVVAGETRSFGAGQKDIWVLKLASNGNIEWQKAYGGRQDEEASCILQTLDGGYIVAASTDTYGAGAEDILILKLQSNGDINPSCTFINGTNAGAADTNINPADTYIDFEHMTILIKDIDIDEIMFKESEAVVYSLCGGQHWLSVTASSGGITVPQPGDYSYDHAESVDLIAYPDPGYKFTGWSGDATSTEKSIFLTMDSDKSVKANFEMNVIEEVWERVKRTPCFIATAVYGSPGHPHVEALREFRDKYLMSSKPGRRLVRLYYEVSPPIADFISQHRALRRAVRLWLLPAVVLAYAMVHPGPVLTTLLLLLFLAAPFCLCQDPSKPV